MVQIVDIVPRRFRPGQRIAIQGFAFAPNFGDNIVTVAGLSTIIEAESETEIEIDVPGGAPQDEFVAVQVQRSDTWANDAASYFCKGPLSDLRDGTLLVPGQAPGADEAPELLVAIPDIPQAKDYEGMATLAEYLLREVLTTAGDLFASDGVAAMQRFARGAAGQVLGANAAAALGLAWGAAPAPRQALSWAKLINAGAGNNGAMVANGDSTNPSIVDGEHAAGQAGTVDRIAVLVQIASGTDTLDQVTLAQNGVVVYNSGAGLGFTQGQSHIAVPAIVVVATDRLELRAFKLGTSGIMRLRGKVGLQ